jgi:tetratricopeptide (TPR) repeat protein
MCCLQVHVRTAQASKESDLDAILAWIGDAHADVDQAVIAALHEWLAVTAQAALDAMAEEERATSALINMLGWLYKQQGKYPLAEALLTEALAGRRSQLGDDHPSTLSSMNSLGGLFEHQGKYSEAEALLTEALAASRRQLGDDHPTTLWCMNDLGLLYKEQGKYTDAEELYTEALAARRRQLGDDHPFTLISMVNLGSLYQEQGQYSEAEALLTKARTPRGPPPSHPCSRGCRLRRTRCPRRTRGSSSFARPSPPKLRVGQCDAARASVLL